MGGLFRVQDRDADALGKEPRRGRDGRRSERRRTRRARMPSGKPSRTCTIPEIPVNIVDLGLVYDLTIGEGGGRWQQRRRADDAHRAGVRHGPVDRDGCTTSHRGAARRCRSTRASRVGSAVESQHDLARGQGQARHGLIDARLARSRRAPAVAPVMLPVSRHRAQHGPDAGGRGRSRGVSCAGSAATGERSRSWFDLLTRRGRTRREPIALRHPVVFYEGHVAAFNVNTLGEARPRLPGVDADLEDSSSAASIPTRIDATRRAALELADAAAVLDVRRRRGSSRRGGDRRRGSPCATTSRAAPRARRCSRSSSTRRCITRPRSTCSTACLTATRSAGLRGYRPLVEGDPPPPAMVRDPGRDGDARRRSDRTRVRLGQRAPTYAGRRAGVRDRRPTTSPTATTSSSSRPVATPIQRSGRRRTGPWRERTRPPAPELLGAARRTLVLARRSSTRSRCRSAWPVYVSHAEADAVRALEGQAACRPRPSITAPRSGCPEAASGRCRGDDARRQPSTATSACGTGIPCRSARYPRAPAPGVCTT